MPGPGASLAKCPPSLRDPLIQHAELVVAGHQLGINGSRFEVEEADENSLSGSNGTITGDSNNTIAESQSKWKRQSEQYAAGFVTGTEDTHTVFPIVQLMRDRTNKKSTQPEIDLMTAC